MHAVKLKHLNPFQMEAVKTMALTGKRPRLMMMVGLVRAGVMTGYPDFELVPGLKKEVLALHKGPPRRVITARQTEIAAYARKVPNWFHD